MKNQVLMVSLVLVILAGAGGFLAGMKYQETKTSQRDGQSAGGSGQRRGQFGQRNGAGRPVAGDIISADDKSITVKMMDGSSKIVLLSSSTQINKAATATKADLKTGEKVAVFGTDNADGSVTAASIQLNPMFRGATGTPSASPR